MTERHVRVTLLVWRPRDPEDPGDLTYGWPHVLQTRDAATPWQLPGVLLRPGERVMTAAGRAAYALGLVLPNAHRVLAIDQHPAGPGRPEQLVIVVDGGWITDDDVPVAHTAATPCQHDCRHASRWAGVDQLGHETPLATALGTALGKLPAFVVNQDGTGAGAGGRSE